MAGRAAHRSETGHDDEESPAMLWAEPTVRSEARTVGRHALLGGHVAGPAGERYAGKCWRTLAAIWRTVIRSTVSRTAIRPPRCFR